MNCCNNKKEETTNDPSLPDVESSATETTAVGQSINPWKAATLVLATSLIFTLAFGTLWMTGVIQIAGPGNTMAMKGGAGEEMEKDPTVLPSVMPESVPLPISWGDLGQKMLSAGVIDEAKITQLYEARGGMSDTMRSMLYNTSAGDVVMTQDNAQDMLNLFWAFGLANQNPILSEGPMTDEQYGGDPSRFAATGGWTLRRGDIMDHYNNYPWVSLTAEQQALVERVSQGIYRPCCNNSTYFPDCNHGMAMLGLLELLAANDVSEEEMYDIALGVNTYWFPGTYETIAAFTAQNGIDFADVPAKDLLGQGLSSASGFAAVKQSLAGPAQTTAGGGGCSV
ncbi:hypothetical protein CL655_02865 [bacterium]|nr:hypothetical protein [bacterium]|tara:strand:+ start:3553 stop:4569 length:1017 start_codon:yes stop_codon:yes gene_type:complete